jgi:4-hydroxythreonine-4-phosphate dehydrogenase
MSARSLVGSTIPIIAVSSGEPAGIGPDICAQLALEELPGRLVVLADATMLTQRIAELNLDVTVDRIRDHTQTTPHFPGRLQVLHIPTDVGVETGRLNRKNADYVLALLRRGVLICRDESNAALVTAPVQKSIINEAGTAFTGHTEFLAEVTDTPTPVMMLACGDLRVALATTHLALADVPRNVTMERLERVISVLHDALINRFNLSEPRIAVLGLNPHAGESGVLGKEEQQIITPVIEKLTRLGISLHGPVPADTAFTPSALERCDAVVAMYHDQGLPVIKALSFGEVVNITLGLPIIRTSVDHGTALDLAGTGSALPHSLREAIRVAAEMASEPSS